MNKLLLLIFLLPSLLLSQNISNLKMKSYDGKKFFMKNNLNNDATIVLFWATWCLPCKKEFTEIQKLQKKYPDKNIKVITISKDTPRSLAKVKSFVKSHSYKFTYLIDPSGEVCSKLLINAVPHSFLVDKNGKVFYSHSGYRKGDEAELERELLKYWKKPQKEKS
ncbi:TlpA family protein disulfide reductase [candidate division KSB1 bacterium]|nr:TlpA family protein disulfide reductase [candidate division KSB1 bacterium]MBL7094691.1 TlpA family protein disulfide reductase [candidate division KSB1 bacterium]